MAVSLTNGEGLSVVTNVKSTIPTHSQISGSVLHTDAVYNALMTAALTMEEKLATSLKTYNEHPDVQANLQQLQYDLQQWNLALTTMTNIQKNMADALASVASNMR